MSNARIGSHRTPKRLRGSIRRDTVKASDLREYDCRFSCEDCTHFNSQDQSCTIGYNTMPHRKHIQEMSFHLSGNLAFCRFLEID